MAVLLATSALALPIHLVPRTHGSSGESRRFSRVLGHSALTPESQGQNSPSHEHTGEHHPAPAEERSDIRLGAVKPLDVTGANHDKKVSSFRRRRRLSLPHVLTSARAHRAERGCGTLCFRWRTRTRRRWRS
jgi:hypothetical protein